MPPRLKGTKIHQVPHTKLGATWCLGGKLFSLMFLKPQVDNFAVKRLLRMPCAVMV